MPEVLEKRTRSSKTHSLGGRKFAWDGTIGSIHYKDAQDTWQNIDNEFLPVAAPWDWEMLKADYHIRVKEDFTAGQIIEFEVQGETVQFQPMALEWTNDLDQIQQISMPQNVTPVITNPVVDLLSAVGVPCHQGTIRWPDAYGQGIDFQWRCASTRLMKTLEIENFNNLPIPQQYILDGGNPVLRLNLIFDPPSKQNVDIVVDGQVWNQQSDVQTFNIIEFVKDGEVLWGFMPLRYWDSTEDNEGQSVATLEKRGNKLYISIRVPYDWLQTAVFPVFIDTDISPQPAVVGASADDRTSKDDDTWRTINDSYLYNYTGAPDSSDLQHSGMRFTGLGLSLGDTIDVAYSRNYVRFNGNPRVDIYAEDTATPLNFADNGLVLIQDRARTSLSTYWNESGLALNAWHNSPSLVDPIQEVVTSYDVDTLVLLFIERADMGTHFLYAAWDYSDNSFAVELHIEYTAAGGTNWVKNLSDTLTIADSISKKPGLIKADSMAIADSFDRTADYVMPLSDSVSIADSIAKVVTKPRADTLTIADSILMGFARIINLADSLGISDSISKGVGKVRADTLAIADTVSKAVGLTKSDSFTIADSFDRISDYVLALSDTVGITDAISKTVTIVKTDTLAITDTVSKAVGLIKSESFAIADTFDRTVASVRSFSDTIAIADVIQKSVTIVKSDLVSITDSLTKSLTSAAAAFLTVRVYFSTRTPESYVRVYRGLIAVSGGAIKYVRAKMRR